MSSVAEQLTDLLLQIQSSDNAVRIPAETRLYTDWLDAGGDRPAQLLVGLAQLAAAGVPTQRASAAVILRRCATRVRYDSAQMLRVIDQISPAARQQVRDLILQGMLTPDQAAFTRHKLADAVAEIARPSAGDPENTQWPGLLDAIAAAAANPDDAAIRETAFRVLGAAPELIDERDEMIGGAVQLLMRGFEDPSEAVRTTATSAFAAFFAHLPKATWGRFKPLLPALLNVMEPLRQSHKETELTGVLESLITLAEIAPRMFQPVFGTLVDFSLAIATEQDFDEAARMSALELMAAFAEEAPNMCRREPKYAAQMIPALLKMLTEVGIDDEDGSEWSNTDDSEQIEEDEAIHSEAKLVTDRLSLSLGGEVVVPPLFEWLPQMFQSAEWRERFAALMALSNAAEGCREEMLPNLGAILKAVEPLLNDPHPRVQWGACNAMGQLSTDLSPEIQEHFGTLILPALIAKLSSESTFKVQAHAAAALVNFSDAADKDTMDPYLDDLLTRLVGLVQSSKRYVQEQALTTIAMVADSAQQLFTKYYDTLMPLVMNIMTADVPSEYRLLKAKAIECSTLIALAVGREKFLPHMQQLGQILLSIQQQSPTGMIETEHGEEEDPCHAYLVQSWGRLCRVIGPDFVPYLPAVMPPLLSAAKSQADCHILDVDQAESLRDTEGWEVVRYAGQWLGIHTAAFEEKASAIELLHVYPRELGAGFWPYVPEIINDVVQPGIKFYYNMRVRTFSLQLIPHLLTSAQAHFGGARDAPDVVSLWLPLLTTLLGGVLRNDREAPGMFAEAFLTIYRAVELIGPAALPEPELNQLSASMLEILSSLKEHLDTRATAEAERRANGVPTSNDEDDEYEEEDLEEDEEEREDEEVIDASNKLIHALLKTFGANLISTPFGQLLTLAQQFVTSPSQDAQLWAVDALADFVEFGKDATAPAAQTLGPYLLNGIQAPSVPPILRAAAAETLGRIALFSGPSLTPLALQALDPLFARASAADARAVENVETTERALGAIARILRVHGPGNLTPEQFTLAVGEWIKSLPITQEPDGASYSYLFLAELMEKKHEVVLTQFDVAFRALVAALAAHTIGGKPAEYAVTQAKVLLESLPREKQLSLFNELPDGHKEIVQTLFA